MKNKSLSILLSSLILIPLVSAQDLFGFLENEWLQFTIVVLILFAVMFNFFKPKFNYNSAPTTIVSGGLAILLTIPIMKRGILEAFISPEILNWIAIIAIAIAILFIAGWAWKKLGFKGLIGMIIFLTFLIYIGGDYLPDSVLYGPLGGIIETIQGFSGFMIWVFIIVLIIWLIWVLFGRRKWERGQEGKLAAVKKRRELEEEQRAQGGIANLARQRNIQAQRLRQERAAKQEQARINAEYDKRIAQKKANAEYIERQEYLKNRR